MSSGFYLLLFLFTSIFFAGQIKYMVFRGFRCSLFFVHNYFDRNFRQFNSLNGGQNKPCRYIQGIKGNTKRLYGLPFLGDNNFLIDKLIVIKPEKLKDAYWYIPEKKVRELMDNSTRMTITINRSDMSKTKSMLFVPVKEEAGYIPEKAWIEVDYNG